MANEYIKGAGGGKKPKTQAPPVEAPNTLRSVAKGRILDLIAYGPIKGPVDGFKSIFLDDTPLENADGTFNFEGIEVDFRHGDPSQEVIPGFIDVSNPREINAEVKFGTPIVRSMLNNEADGVIVTLRLPALLETNETTGDTNPTTLPFRIQVVTSTGSVVQVVQEIIEGKNMAPYEVSYRLNFKGVGPFSVRVERMNKESEKSIKQDSLFWSYLTEVIDVRQSYPNCAMFGISVDARLFGNSIPSRKYLVDLSIVKVPANYNPATRTYSGLWDGSFKEAWTDNPAWCYYDLATHPIIGAGIKNVNKWALYEIGKYCDELVDDGYGGKERRFSCNTLFSAPEDAITALNTLASVFRGMSYWGSSSVEVVADMPGPIRKIITPSDVLDGSFSYEGTSLRERHSVAVVMWNDPEDGYIAKPEMVEDPESIELVGWREVRMTAVACSSRGQARRLGLWTLYSEREETQILSFSVTAKHADFRPGEFFEVQDPYRAGARLSGKLVAVAGRTMTLDADPIHAAAGWDLTYETETGTLQRTKITNVVGSVITLASAPTSIVKVGASYILSSVDVLPRIYRVAAVTEQEGSVFAVSATEHDPRKYDIVEKGLKVPERPSTLLPTGQLTPPSNLTTKTYTYVTGGTSHLGLSIGWTASRDPRVAKYMVDVKSPEDVAFRTVYHGEGLSYDIDRVVAGAWRIRVRATSPEWGNSAWVEKTTDADNLLAPQPPIALHFTATVNAITIMPEYEGTAEFEFWRSMAPLAEDFIESNATYLGTGPFFVDIDLVFDTVHYYYVRTVNIYGVSSWVSGQCSTTADVDDILEIILDDFQQSPIGQWFKGEIDKISLTTPGSVNERITGVDDRLSTLLSNLGDVSASLQAELNRLNVQVSEISSAPFWMPLVTYPPSSVVKYDGKLYRSKLEVPPDTLPTDEIYWEKIGDFASLTEAMNDLAVRVNMAEATVLNLDGVVTPLVAQLNSMSAMWRQNDDGVLNNALEQWRAKSTIVEDSRVRANQLSAIASKTTALTAEMGEVKGSLIRIDSAFASELEAMAQSLIQLRAQINDEIMSAITQESVVRASKDDVLASQITALQAKVTGDISASLVSEALVRADADTALASLINLLTAKVGENSASIVDESVVRATANEATAQRFTRLEAKVGTDITASIHEEALIRATADSAMAGKLTQLEAAMGSANAAILSEQAARATQDTALSQSLNTLYGTVDLKGAVYRQAARPTGNKLRYGDIWVNTDEGNRLYIFTGTSWELSEDARIPANTAAVQTEKTSRITADAAIGSRIDTVEAVFENKINLNRAATQSVSSAVSTLESSTASRLNTLTAEVQIKNRTFSQTSRPYNTAAYTLVIGDMWINPAQGNKLSRWSGSSWVETTDNRVTYAAASIQQISNAQANTDGKLEAMWGVKLQLNQGGVPVIAGVGLGIDNHNGVIKSRFLIKSDTFAVMNGLSGAETIPFAIAEGRVIIQDALIRDASITNAKIKDASITNAKIANLAVDTLNLRGNAVTVPMAITYGSRPLEPGNIGLVGPLYVPAEDVRHILISATVNVLSTYGNPALDTFSITAYVQDPAERAIAYSAISVSANQSSSLTCTGTATVPYGVTGAIAVYARIRLSGARSIGYCTLSVTGVKK